MANLPDSEYSSLFLDEDEWDQLNELANTRVSATHQTNSILYHSFNSMSPYPYNQLQPASLLVTRGLGSPVSTSIYHSTPPPNQHIRRLATASTSNSSGVRRRTIRYGCKLCPGIHFDRKQSSSTSGSNKGVQGHFIAAHLELANSWQLYVYTWGYRVTYHDESIKDEPNAGSAASVMTTFGARGGTYGRSETLNRGETGVITGSGGADEVQVMASGNRIEDVDVQNYNYDYGYTEPNNDSNSYPVDSRTGGYHGEYTSARASESFDTSTNYNTPINHDTEVDAEDDILNHLHPALFMDNQDSQGYNY